MAANWGTIATWGTLQFWGSTPSPDVHVVTTETPTGSAATTSLTGKVATP